MVISTVQVNIEAEKKKAKMSDLVKKYGAFLISG